MHLYERLQRTDNKVITIPYDIFLFAELQSHNIWRKLKNHMKNDIPNIPSQLRIFDSNLLEYEFHHIVIKFYHKICLVLSDQSSLTASGGQFLAHKKCVFLNMPVTLVLRISNFVKMQGNLWKHFTSLPAPLKILVFYNFFPNFSNNCILRTSIF